MSINFTINGYSKVCCIYYEHDAAHMYGYLSRAHTSMINHEPWFDAEEMKEEKKTNKAIRKFGQIAHMMWSYTYSKI